MTDVDDVVFVDEVRREVDSTDPFLCTSHLEATATIEVRTSDGRLSDQWPVTLRAYGPDTIQMTSAIPDPLHGELTIQPGVELRYEEWLDGSESSGNLSALRSIAVDDENGSTEIAPVFSWSASLE